ncbi:hypothetical protein EW146_g9257 [Bondarzewia mesenterica]|uniref:Uncharacterized protein n=1 Tax=Bondarzewia mesenterica TaxID=1095465 RepID=A0A4S4L9C1_9AGAM|nr:hypothetical protein EW146_g9257 [Bondarzewia mesenterica]
MAPKRRRASPPLASDRVTRRAKREADARVANADEVPVPPALPSTKRRRTSPPQASGRVTHRAKREADAKAADADEAPVPPTLPSTSEVPVVASLPVHSPERVPSERNVSILSSLPTPLTIRTPSYDISPHPAIVPKAEPAEDSDFSDPSTSSHLVSLGKQEADFARTHEEMDDDVFDTLTKMGFPKGGSCPSSFPIMLQVIVSNCSELDQQWATYNAMNLLVSHGHQLGPMLEDGWTQATFNGVRDLEILWPPPKQSEVARDPGEDTVPTEYSHEGRLSPFFLLLRTCRP